MSAGNHGSCIHHLGPDICSEEYNYHDSLQARLITGIGHCSAIEIKLYNAISLFLRSYSLLFQLHCIVCLENVRIAIDAIVIRCRVSHVFLMTSAERESE